MADLNNLLGNINVEDDGYTKATNNISNEDNDNNSEDGDTFSKQPMQGGMTNKPESDGRHDTGEELELSEYDHLKLLWTQELACPELLPYDAECIENHMNLLRNQEDVIDDVMEGRYTDVSNSFQQSNRPGRNRVDSEADQMLNSLSASILRMECDRIRFVLADLARVRLMKIEKHALHNRSMLDRMSDDEVTYLQQYGQLIEKHFNKTVLNHLPKKVWRNLDDAEMIDKPDLNSFVFCRVVETVEIDDRDDDDDGENDGPQEHVAGSSLIARYSAIQHLVMDGKIILLA